MLVHTIRSDTRKGAMIPFAAQTRERGIEQSFPAPFGSREPVPFLTGLKSLRLYPLFYPAPAPAKMLVRPAADGRQRQCPKMVKVALLLVQGKRPFKRNPCAIPLC
jgi:hypothetical protein